MTRVKKHEFHATPPRNMSKSMGYMMSKHVSLFHFSPYFLLFRRHPIPPFSIATQMDQVVDLDSPNTWARVIAKRATLFRKVMPMAMENLSIV